MEFKITDFENGKVNIKELLDTLMPTNRPSIEALADVLYPDIPSMSRRSLANYLYGMMDEPEEHYCEFTVRKRSGAPRVITKPDEAMADIQKRIYRYILRDVPVIPCAAAYVKGRSLRTATEKHIGYPVLLKMDIKGFFDSITFGRVQQVFLELGFDAYQAISLARLCCYYGRLPQGTSTSPMLSNLVMRDFDREVWDFCLERGIVYTRYSDDMLFSGRFMPVLVEAPVRRMLKERGFRLNERKTKEIWQGQRQTALGVTLNEKQQAPKEYRKKIRQEIHFCRKYSVKGHLEHIGDTRFLRANGEPDYAAYLNHLLGRINFALQINPADGEMLSYQRAVRDLMKSLYVVDRTVQDDIYRSALAYYNCETYAESLQEALEAEGYSHRDMLKSRLFYHRGGAFYEKLSRIGDVDMTHDDEGNPLGLLCRDAYGDVCRQAIHPCNDGFYGVLFDTSLGYLIVTSDKALPLQTDVPNLVSFHNHPQRFFLSQAKRDMLERFGNTVMILDCSEADYLRRVFQDADIRVL